MLDRVNSGIESNVNNVFEKLPELTAASSDGNPEKVEEVAQELTEFADQSNKLLDDNGLKEFIEEVELKSDSCSDYEAKKKFGILSNNINDTISNLTKTVKSNAQAVDQRAQSFGASASGRTMKVDAKTTVSLSESDWADVQQTTEMQNEFRRKLQESGQTVVSDSSKTDVTCGEGKVIASKGQCETSKFESCPDLFHQYS